jgi:hypothetical protein
VQKKPLIEKEEVRAGKDFNKCNIFSMEMRFKNYIHKQKILYSFWHGDWIMSNRGD